LPVDIKITVLPAVGSRPLGDQIAAATGSADDAVMIAVPVGTAGGTGGREASSSQVDTSEGAGSGELVVADLDTYLHASVGELAERHGMSGKAGEVRDVPAEPDSGFVRVVLLGIGDGSPTALRRAGAALGRRLAGTAGTTGRGAITTAVADAPDEGVHAFVEGLLLGGYTFSMKSRAAGRDTSGAAAQPVGQGLAPGGNGGSVGLLVTGPRDRDAVVERAAVIANAVVLARDLVNTPSARKTPEWLATQACAVAERSGIAARVLAERDLAAAGFGGILAVGSGSARPPRLIELSYQPPGWDRHVVLVGKGITFDSGGLSLKPTDGMKLMKTDMAGGAAVIAAMSALAVLGVRSRVTGLVAAAENMPSGSAMRPGDVITHYGGRTVEVLNTDAEGRLVLADALAYADAALDPDVVVDIATLTGAARIALGSTVGALYATDDALAAALLAASHATGEQLWRMPLAGDYRGALDSATADLAHIASAGNGAAPGSPGSIVAALFLREFTGARRWAHLDIAGPARAASDDGEITKGGTGFGTRLLLHWLTAPAP